MKTKTTLFLIVFILLGFTLANSVLADVGEIWAPYTDVPFTPSTGSVTGRFFVVSVNDRYFVAQTDAHCVADRGSRERIYDGQVHYLVVGDGERKRKVLVKIAYIYVDFDRDVAYIVYRQTDATRGVKAETLSDSPVQEKDSISMKQVSNAYKTGTVNNVTLAEASFTSDVDADFGESGSPALREGRVVGRFFGIMPDGSRCFGTVDKETVMRDIRAINENRLDDVGLVLVKPDGTIPIRAKRLNAN